MYELLQTIKEDQDAILNKLGILDSKTGKLEDKVNELLRDKEKSASSTHCDTEGTTISKGQQGTVLDVIQNHLISSQPGDYFKKNTADKCVLSGLKLAKDFTRATRFIDRKSNRCESP